MLLGHVRIHWRAYVIAPYGIGAIGDVRAVTRLALFYRQLTPHDLSHITDYHHDAIYLSVFVSGGNLVYLKPTIASHFQGALARIQAWSATAENLHDFALTLRRIVPGGCDFHKGFSEQLLSGTPIPGTSVGMTYNAPAIKIKYDFAHGIQQRIQRVIVLVRVGVNAICEHWR